MTYYCHLLVAVLLFCAVILKYYTCTSHIAQLFLERLMSCCGSCHLVWPLAHARNSERGYAMLLHDYMESSCNIIHVCNSSIFVDQKNTDKIRISMNTQCVFAG